MALTDYRTLGRSGLAVSPLALGTMTFGMARWGSNEDESRAVFDAYVDAGGNFIDTADVYSSGVCEEMLGAYVTRLSSRPKLGLRPAMARMLEAMAQSICALRSIAR
jgi:aryl-alcohol dehydrogenase-like predicted oxidoreductase